MGLSWEEVIWDQEKRIMRRFLIRTHHEILLADQIEEVIDGHVACTRQKKNTHRILVGKPEGKRSFGRPRHGVEVNVKMNFQEMGCEGMDRINLAKNKDMLWTVENIVINLGIP